MKTSFACMLLGHKFEKVISVKDYVREDGEDMRRTEWRMLPNCFRCGTPNPILQENKEENRP